MREISEDTPTVGEETKEKTPSAPGGAGATSEPSAEPAEHEPTRETHESPDAPAKHPEHPKHDEPVEPDDAGDEDDTDTSDLEVTGESATISSPPPPPVHAWHDDVEATVNLTGDLFPLPGRDDLDEPTKTTISDDLDLSLRAREAGTVARTHLKGLLEALVFASDVPIKTSELTKAAAAPSEEVKHLLGQLHEEYATRGMQLVEVAGGWVFRTNAAYAPFVRDVTKQKPVKLSRAQIETLAILAYRQPITRPEIDEIRGVDSGATLKMLLERELVKILGKKDEPGRPLLYGTTPVFLELFSLKSLKDLPTLREFTELNEDSRRVVERELGETLVEAQGGVSIAPPPVIDGGEGAAAVDFDPTLPQQPMTEADTETPTEDKLISAEPVEDVAPAEPKSEEKAATDEADEDEDDEPDSDDFDDDDDDEDDEDDEEDEEEDE